MQAQTKPLDSLPPELAKGHWLVMAHNGISLFTATVNKTQALWALSFRAPRAHAAELNELFSDPKAAQVRR